MLSVDPVLKTHLNVIAFRVASSLNYELIEMDEFVFVQMYLSRKTIKQTALKLKSILSLSNDVF